ncbi:MAG: hypothetical protein KC636_24970 [Myxococcales bacterium]|nr:hypothetical protein [Myxococcales bacterium]
MSARSRPPIVDEPVDLLPAPGWLAAALAPDRCLGVAMTRGAPRLELTRDGIRRALLITQASAATSSWPFVQGGLAVGYPGDAGGDHEALRELCCELGERLHAREAAVLTWIAATRWLVQTLDEPERLAPPPAELVALAGAELSPCAALLRAARARGEPCDAALVRAAIDASSRPAIRAAGALLLFALGEYADGLARWSELPGDRDRAGLVEAHAHAIANAMLGRAAPSTSWIERAVELLEAAPPRADADAVEAWMSCAHYWIARRRPERARTPVERALAAPLAPRRAAELRRTLAQLSLHRGDPAATIEALGETAPEDPHERLAAARLAADAGAFRRAEAWLATLVEAPGAVVDEAAIELARLRLWRGDTDGAAALLGDRSRAEDPRGARLLGASAVLTGDLRAAHAHLDHALARDPSDVEALRWRAEAHLRARDLKAANAALDQSFLLENAAASLLIKAIVHLESRLIGPRVIAKLAGSGTYLDGFFRQHIHTLADPAATRAALEDPRELAAHLRSILARLGGSRATRATLLTAPGAAEPLVYAATASGRDDSANNLMRLAEDVSVVELLSTFTALKRRYPESPHPYTYRGELLLWLGDYRGALADFNRVLRIAPTRWAYVGKAAALMLTGHPRRASWVSTKGVARFGRLASATTHVYRGELRRLHGRAREAIADLELAVHHKPARIGAWVNLALARVELGDPGARAALDELEARAPAVLWESARSLGERPRARITTQDRALLERALVLMRGNRSSVIHTIFPPGESMRVIPAPSRWRAQAREALAVAAIGLRATLIDAVTRALDRLGDAAP